LLPETKQVSLYAIAEKDKYKTEDKWTSDKIGGQVEDNLSKFNHIS
jgi:hypothetical protein